MSDPFEGIQEASVPQEQPQPKPRRSRPKHEPSHEEAPSVVTPPQPRESAAVMKQVKASMNEEKREDEQNAKTYLISRIQKYFQSKFAKYLREKKFEDDPVKLRRMTVEDLQMQIKAMDLSLGERQNNNVFNHGVKVGMQFIEEIVHAKSQFKVRGTTDACFADQHFEDTLERAKLKYNLDFIKIEDPILQMGYIIANAAMICHKQNSIFGGLGQPATNLKTEIDSKEIERALGEQEPERPKLSEEELRARDLQVPQPIQVVSAPSDGQRPDNINN